MEQSARIEKVNQLLSQGREANTVEFKANWDAPNHIGQYLSAMANAAVLAHHDQAWMIWGIEDATCEVKGTDFDPHTKKAENKQPLIMWLTQKISPKPDFEFFEVSHPKGRVVLLEIKAPRTAPLAFDGVRYIRIDSHKTKLSEHPDKEQRIWELLGQKSDWSGEIVPEATMDDLDQEAICTARKRFIEHLLKGEVDSTRYEQIHAEAQAWDVETLLNKARLTKAGKITRAALLLLGKDESAHHLSPVDAKLSWILRDAFNATVSSQHFGMPLLLSTEKVFSKIRNLAIEHMPDGTLFPTAVQAYDPWVIREALHNCIAHQDYRLGGKVNIVEHPEKLVFTNLGQFIPPSVEWMLEYQSPPEHYRNQWLIDGMIRLRMIDQVGSGIRRMFQTQRNRFFPLPDFVFGDNGVDRPRVEVVIAGQIMDVRYTQMLSKLPDLTLSQVLLLDKLQKKKPLSTHEVRELKLHHLIEGRAPNFFISSVVAELTSQQASYIHNRGLSDDHYRSMIVEYLKSFKQATRKNIDELLLDKLPDVLNEEQKNNKIRNLLTKMRNSGVIQRSGSRAASVWRLATGSEHSQN